MTIDKTKHFEMYLKMVQTRRFEETAAKLFTMGKVHGTAHFCIGEEATGIGATCVLETDDLIYATHRGHGQSIGKNMDINRMFAEFLGKASGVCRGKGGCMHIADLSAGNLGANGIVGGGIPVAVGAALSQKMQNKPGIVLCFFGDGACNEGTFHEAANLAAIWDLPIIFFCVNNQYGMSMHVEQHMRPEIAQNISIRASSYGFEGLTVDGNDVCAIYDIVKLAKEKIQTTGGPIMITANTYRIMGHSKSDANLYRSKETIKEWREKCPIKQYRAKLAADGIATEAELAALETQAAVSIDAAREWAEAQPDPELHTALEDVWA